MTLRTQHSSNIEKAYPLPPLVEKPAAATRLLTNIDISGLVALVGQFSDLVWTRHSEVRENDETVFHATQHIVMRYPWCKSSPWIVKHHSVAAMLWPLVAPIIKGCANQVHIDTPFIPRAMFSRLPPGQEIPRHIDGGRTNLRAHKIHVPLITAQGAEMLFGRTRHYFRCGEAWLVNNIKPHGARNHADIHRVHLIFEIVDAQHGPDGIDYLR